MADKAELTYPKSSVNLSLKIDGIYGFPQQWKTTDQANPGMFTYIVKFSSLQAPGGKIYPRQLTQKQLREQEQAKKKGGKKQAKKQQNPAQAQKLKEQLQKQQAEQKRRQQLWNKMTEQQRIYFTNQDKFKSPALRFENGVIEKTYNGNLFVVFQERVTKDKGEWVYLYKLPTANQQDLEKLKKSKPKNLNLNDLNPVCMRAWVNLEKLNSSQVAEVHELRCKLQQVDQTQQSPKPNLQKCYIKLSLTLSTPILQTPSPTTLSTLIKDPPSPPQLPAQQKHLLQLSQQLNLAIQSLAMQYSTMFWKDLNANEEQKFNNIFVTNKKNQNNRRKEQFLYDFNVSGKYKVLKERLKKIIVHLCESKFSNKMEGGKSFTGITCSVRDQFYSEIYNFLVTSYSETMSQLIQQKKHKLKEVFVLNQQTQQGQTQQTLQQYRKQPSQQRFNRIISEYILIENYEYGREMYKTAIIKNPDNVTLKYQYSIFCLKNGLANLAEVMGWGYLDQYVETRKDDKDAVVQYVVFNIGVMGEKGFKRAWALLRVLLQEEPGNIRLLMLGVLTADLLGKSQTSEKLKHRAYREHLRKHSKLPQQGSHQSSPIQSEIPSLQSVATYKSELSGQQKDSLYFQLIEQFSQYGIFAIIQKIKQKLENAQTPKMKKQNLKILYFQKNYDQCKEQAIGVYKEGKDFQVLKMIINCCEKLGESEEKIKYLKVALTDSSGGPKNKQYALLNLGLFYLRNQKYGNAKACLTKYLDANKEPGGLSWMMLGQAELMCGNYQISAQCFRHSNLSDPYNKQVWLWLAQSYAKLRNFVMVNQCLNCYLQSESENKILKSKLQQLRQLLKKPIDSPSFYETSIKQKLVKKLEAY